MMKIWLTLNTAASWVEGAGASRIWGKERSMDDYTFPFLLSLAMAVVCLAAIVAHGVGL